MDLSIHKQQAPLGILSGAGESGAILENAFSVPIVSEAQDGFL